MSAACVGDRVWLPHEEHAWLSGRVIKIDAIYATIDTDVGQIKIKTIEANKLEACGSHVDSPMDNLVDLDELSEGAILHHARKRYKNQTIYTNVGAILVAVNPFERLDIYGDKDVKLASNPSMSKPHVFVTAFNSYQQLRINLKNQAVLISGESGAGKTETTKKVLTYLANVAPGAKKGSADEAGIEEQILQSNPILEALGNAKTLRNDNSSRFGKWMKVDFDHDFRIQGCEIVNYLLEKSRVVVQTKGERNYHIFYQLIAGADPSLKSRLKLGPLENYRLLNQSGCTVIESMDDSAEFRDVVAAMVTLSFIGDFSEMLYSIIACILHLGNIDFESSGEGSQVSNRSLSTVNTAAILLGVDPTRLSSSFSEKHVQMARGESVTMKLTMAQAIDTRDTLVKALYSNLFDYTVKRVNETLKLSVAPFSIGILDIFGFEIFDLNSFEQLSINYANEKLQLHFNEVIFDEEMKMYMQEGIPAEAIEFVDNAECVNLIEGKPLGLLALLDEECSLGKATDLTYANKIDGIFGKGKKTENIHFNRNRTDPEKFTVVHFAGPVEYTVTGFLEKNRDSMSNTVQEAMQSSSNRLVAGLFVLDDTPASGPGSPAPAPGRGKAAAKATLGGQFRNQLIGLVSNLRLTEPHFIRCVKPNHQKKPKIFDGQLILRQLRYAGLFEAIRIRKSGYAYRVPHDIFCHQYAILVDGVSTRLQNKEMDVLQASTEILQRVTEDRLLGAKVSFVGKTRVFIKTNQDRILLDRERGKRVHVYALRIQDFGRRMIEYTRRNKAAIERKRQQLQLEERERKRQRAVLNIQKIIRGFMVRRALQIMAELVSLRKTLASRDVISAENTIAIIEKRGGDLLPEAFKHEVLMAKTMVKLILIQDKFIKSVERALVTKSVPDLNKLLVKGDRLDLSDHPTVLRAKAELGRLHKKRKVMITMIEFLRSENDHCEIIPETLEAAEELGVDPDFIAKVQRVYDSASPRLRARNKLRRAVEVIDKDGLVEACQEVEDLQQHHQGFAEIELRAARSLLRMIEMESSLHLPRRKNAEGSFEIPTGPRLDDDVLAICHEITACSVRQDREGVKLLHRKLLFLTNHDPDQFEMIIRSFKWSKIFCAWKYPEVQAEGGGKKKPASRRVSDSLSNASVLDDREHRGGDRDRDGDNISELDTLEDEFGGEGEFYGLRPGEARFSKYIVRSLHRDVDPQSGNAPASIQAALGAMESALADPLGLDKKRGEQTPEKGKNPKIIRKVTWFIYVIVCCYCVLLLCVVSCMRLIYIIFCCIMLYYCIVYTVYNIYISLFKTYEIYHLLFMYRCTLSVGRDPRSAR
jgi:myosin heavy subunit